MTVRLALIFAATILASANAFAQENAASATGQLPPPEAKELAESCAARKFETTVEVSVDGKKRGSKVRLCGKEGQTDADWARTLKDAATKIETNETMARAVKDQIIAALNAEISKIAAANAVAITAPVVTAPPPASIKQATVSPPPTAPAAAAKLPPPAPALAPRKPRLKVQCLTPAELGGGGSCVSMRRNTVLTIRANEDLVGGARLRFLRGRDVRGEIALAQMRQGQSLRYKLPPPLCAGVYRSTVEIQILGRGVAGTGADQVADTLGPFELRC